MERLGGRDQLQHLPEPLWNGDSFVLIGSTTSTSATNGGLKSGTKYYYEVTAVKSALESSPSNIASGDRAIGRKPELRCEDLPMLGLASRDESSE